MNSVISDVRSLAESPCEEGMHGMGLAKPLPHYSVPGRLRRLGHRAQAAWWLLLGRGELCLYGRYHRLMYAQAERDYDKAKPVDISDEQIERMAANVMRHRGQKEAGE